MYCGFRPGPTGVTLPSRQDDESVRAPALCCCCCCGDHGGDWWRARGECTVNTNTLPRSSCCSVVTRSPAVHFASPLLGTPTQSSRSPRAWHPNVRVHALISRISGYSDFLGFSISLPVPMSPCTLKMMSTLLALICMGLPSSFRSLQ